MITRVRLLRTSQKNLRLAAAPWALLAAVCIWGFGYVITKVTLEDEIPPLLLTASSYGFGALGVLPMLAAKRRELAKKGVLWEGALLGVILFTSRLFQVLGCGRTTAGKNAFITGAYVVIVPFFMWLVRRERLQPKSVAAAFAALIGIGMVSVNEKLTGLNLGDVLTLVASTGFALHIVYNGVFARDHDPWVLGGLQLVFAAAFSAAALLLSRTTLPPAFYTVKFQGAMFYNGVFGMSVGFLLQSFGQRYLAQSKAAMILSMESVSGALFAVVFLGERFGGISLAGCAVIFSAIAASFVSDWGRGFKKQKMQDSYIDNLY